MFRIDVYQPKEEKPTQPPLYACLSTAVASEHGQLMTAGRKNATVLFESDKSVSRDHLHLHLMSHHKEHQEALVLNGEDDPVAAGAMAPQSQDEKYACSQDPRGMALLVKNLGKFGSAVLALEPNADEDKKGNNNSNAEKKTSPGSDSETDAGGSDTEDESQEKAAPSGGLPSVPGVTWFEQTKRIAQSLSNGVKMTPKKLDAKETFAVPGNASTILIQCGQVASLLVLTRLDLNFCKSGLSTGDASLWRNRLYAVGGTLIDKNVDTFMVESSERSRAKQQQQSQGQNQNQNQNGPPTTYMLTKTEREASSKQIVAWLLNIPFITTSFLEALFQRKTASDPWPKVEEYAPSNGSHNFWDADCPTKSRLLESCTYLCTSNKQTDMECLVKAAGGHVVSLYDMKEDDAQNTVQGLMEDPDKKDALFTISASGRNKLAKYVKSQGIAQLSPKEITTCVCSREMPKDKETGRVIGKPPAAKEDDQPAGKAPEDGQVPHSESTEKPSGSDKPLKGSAKEKGSEPKTKSRSDKSPKRKRDPEPEVANEEEKKEKPRKGKSDSQTQRALDVLPPVQEEDENLNKTAVESMGVEPDEVEKPSKKRTRQEEEEEEESYESKKSSRTSRPQVQPAGSGTARLETTKDGWMVAAPKDESRRQAYLRPRNEMLETCSQEKPPEVAPTVACKDLICRRYDPNRNKSITGVRLKSSGGKDFKRFRKNPIKQVSGSSRIKLRSVLPKESERQRQLDEEQRALEAQQRKADELFQNEPRQGRITKPAATRKRRNV